MLIDDDAGLRAALEAALASHGHEVASAQDGLAALRAAIDQRPEVIVSDVNMPYLEGPDAVRILKALPQFRDVPVVFMSGAELPPTGLAEATLRKPVSVERLVALVERVARPAAGKAPPSPSPAPRPTPGTADDAGWDRERAAASLAPPAGTACAARICRGIELMHAQAARIGQLRRGGLDTEESERLYNQLVDSVANLLQYLSTEAALRARYRR
ncbi:response regulator [Paraburkholderia sp. ZP32-5]|uniref:response regulator n=1 Tax=Paraburkholderia sp. ZP32-5 TaxID=2883245 RepID=UPI001F3F9827|nr:response regulator [Paraburkholderia sp. ZP32-5]